MSATPALVRIAENVQARHVVQFYEDDAVLCESVARYLGEGLAAGDPVIVIATAPHRASFAASLVQLGHDVDAATACGQLAMLDAEATLAQLLVGGEPVRDRFVAVVGGALDHMRATRPDRPVRAFGEMVDLLWRAGNRRAALALEGLWNELAITQHFDLMCAYVMGNFYKAADGASFDAVCDAHTHVVPAEAFTGRFRELSSLQQRACALEHEVAERKQLEIALREALGREKLLREQAERTLRFNEMFAGMLGHDLRNPLSTIAMGASHIVRSADSDKAVRTATRIVASAERMRRMVDQLLDLTRLRVGGGFQLSRSRVDLAEVWQRTADEIDAGIAIQPRGDTIGEWDADRLAQVASNLTHNAHVHGAKPITIKIDGRDRHRVIALVHSGGAIAPDLLPTLFEPFRGTPRRAQSQGLGLGLYITQQIVAAHGGSIEVASTYAGGTTFHVSIPRP